MKTTKRDDEFRVIIQFVQYMHFYELKAFEQLRSLWTAYCIHWNLEVDTSEYDEDMNVLFNLVNALAHKNKTQMLDAGKLKRLSFENFDNYMAKYVC